MNPKYQDVLDNPKKYKGCPLCLGRQVLWEFGVEASGSPPAIFPSTKIICPECKGLGVVPTQEYEEEILKKKIEYNQCYPCSEGIK